MSNKHKKKNKQKVKEQQREQLTERVTRKTIRHNTAANQEKHRPDWLPLQPDELGRVADRRVMRRDERERRLQATAVDTLFVPLEETNWQQLAANSSYDLGAVVEVSRGLCRVAVNGGISVCEIRGTLIAEQTGYANVVAVGDRVLVDWADALRGVVAEVLPRRSGLVRADSFDTHLQQMLAANIDQLLIVAAWREPQIWWQMIDEYLIGALRNELAVTICINKVDLAGDVAECQTAVQPYREMGHPLLFTSVVTGLGLAELRQALAGRTTVVAGLSGVGKSSLISAVDPTLDLKVAAVSRLKSREGRHTTTQAVMHPLAMGGYVVDTPGVKDLGLLGLEPADLLAYYPEIAALAGQCRFSNCTHRQEPGCVVQPATRSTADVVGRIASWRLQNYQNLLLKLAE